MKMLLLCVAFGCASAALVVVQNLVEEALGIYLIAVLVGCWRGIAALMVGSETLDYVLSFFSRGEG